MKALRNYLDKIKPNFEEGGKLHAFRSVFDGFETFLFVDGYHFTAKSAGIYNPFSLLNTFAKMEFGDY